MKEEELKNILQSVQNGSATVEDALGKLKEFPYADLGFAKLDFHREIRTGYPEIVYCSGKTTEQIRLIFRKMNERNTNVIGTRASKEVFLSLQEEFPDMVYYPEARILSIRKQKKDSPESLITVVSAGTSDMPVAEEAAITAELLNNQVARVYDAGVAGIHRLLDHMDEIRQSRVVIVIAGMEGALASIVGGLVDKPVIAVPTSVGYGANFQGVSALLAMLTSCASGVSVVNIDNGFGAGFTASMINHL